MHSNAKDVPTMAKNMNGDSLNVSAQATKNADDNDKATEPPPNISGTRSVDMKTTNTSKAFGNTSDSKETVNGNRANPPEKTEAQHETRPDFITRISNDKVQHLFHKVSLITLTKKLIRSKSHAVQKVLNKIFLREPRWKNEHINLPAVILDYLPQVKKQFDKEYKLVTDPYLAPYLPENTYLKVDKRPDSGKKK
jgi:hypothetical protein